MIAASESFIAKVVPFDVDAFYGPILTRGFQAQFFKNVLSQGRAPQSGYLVAPPGSGKTLVQLCIAHAVLSTSALLGLPGDRRVVVLTKTHEAAQQFLDVWQRMFEPSDVCGRHICRQVHSIASGMNVMTYGVATMLQRDRSFMWNSLTVDALILDELHSAFAKESHRAWSAITAHCGAVPLVVGATATLWRQDGALSDVNTLVGNCLLKVDPCDALGYRARVKVYEFVSSKKQEDVRSLLMAARQRGLISLVFVTSPSDACALARSLGGLAIVGSDKDAYRKRCISELLSPSAKARKALFTTVPTEGWDIPALNLVIQYNVTKGSKSAEEQRIGRVERMSKTTIKLCVSLTSPEEYTARAQLREESAHEYTTVRGNMSVILDALQ